MKRLVYLIPLMFILNSVSISKNYESTISIEDIEIHGINETAVTNITVSSLPNGLSGYNLTISISNSSIAEIESIEFPEWATLHANSSLPSSSVWIKAVDLNENVEVGAKNVILATITIKSKNEGYSSINISITKIDDDEGYPIDVIVENASLTVFTNHPPNKPSSPYPANGATNVAITTTLTWQCYDEDGDTITYDVYFGTSTNPPKVASNITSNSYNPEMLQYSTTYYWRIVAWDEHGAKNSSETWHFTTEAYVPPNHPPTVTITYPSDGTTVSGVLTIQGKASDEDGNETIQKVEIRIDDGNWIVVNGTTSWSYEWNTSQVENGEHTIYARAYDGELYSDIASIKVNVFNNHKPFVEIIEPENGSVVKGSIIIKGKAWDIDGNETIQKVEIRIDDERWVQVAGRVIWNYSWNTQIFERNGYYTIEARAWDGEKYSAIDSITVFVNNLIHLQLGYTYRGFVTPNIPQEHWIRLYRNKTYKITLRPAPYSQYKADFKLEIINVTEEPIDENGKGYGEEYTFRCNYTDKYFIRVISDIDAPYYLEIQEIHQLTKEEVLMLVGFLAIMCIIALLPVISDYLHQKIKKVKWAMGKQIILSFIDYIAGTAFLYSFFMGIYDLGEKPSLKNALLLSLSAFIYPLYRYWKEKRNR